MAKKQKNFVAKRKEKSNESENVNNDSNYDSMIENGTSDEDEDEASDSNDGFSDNETKTEKIKAQKLKRKNPPINSQNADIKKPKFDSNTKHLYKQPTVEEINQLKETENLFHSNLFRMQINEMLKELKIKEKYKNFMTCWLKEFNVFLKDLKSQPAKENYEEITWLKKSKIKIPIFMENIQSKQFNFQFLKPSIDAFLIGSSAAQTMFGTKLKCDVCVAMPAKSFQKGDYLNLVYEQKRALYLCYIAHSLKNKQFSCSDMKFNYFENNIYKPILEIIPNGNFGKKLTFRIFIVPDSNDFKLNRFVPWNSNIRDNLFTNEPIQNDEIVFATPNYNSGILFDLTLNENENLIKEIIGSNKNLQDGLILLKIWLKQRQLNNGFSGFTNFIMTMFVISLYKQKKIHSSMSSYQVARNVWNHIASSCWNEDDKGLTMCTDFSPPNLPTLQQMHAYYDIVFIDSTGFYNICSNLSLDIYLRIKYEANRAIELLNNYKINSFQQLFMIKFPIYTQFDHIFGLTKSSLIDNLLQTYGEKCELHNFAGFWYPHALKMITNVLRKGLNDRIISLTPIETVSNSWNCTESPKQLKKSLTFGLVLNPLKAYEILDKGPQANDSAVEKFRSFWGAKSDLRRFQDGSITEACVWCTANDSLIEKRLIVKKIILHLLKHHFNLENLTYLADEFDIAYKLNRNINYSENNAENTSLQVIKSFDNIGKKLRSLIDLPLDITGVLGTSTVFRYCDPIPILNDSKVFKENEKIVFKANKICHGVIQLGVSGKWPNELNAFRRLKTAFHIQIAKSLAAKFKLRTRGSINGVDILSDGYVFCLEISHQKEIALLKKEMSFKKIIQYKDTPESIEVEKRLNILPKLTSSLHSLYQNYPSFGPTVMIATRWLKSQLIDSFLWPDECTELIIASQFIKTNALPNPCQPQTGFLRFLQLLSNTDWLAEFIFINFNDEVSQDEITELENNFNTNRESFPTLFISTSYDQKKFGIWNEKSPNVQVLARVTLLARHTLNILDSYFTLEKPIIVKDVFTASLDGYDVIIELKENFIQMCQGYDFENTNNMNKKLPLADLNLVEKGLQELRDGYSEFAVFFYNPYGGKFIAVIWKPEIFNEKEFKLISINGCKSTDDDKLNCNINALIEDFQIILKDLYISIKSNR